MSREWRWALSIFVAGIGLLLAPLPAPLVEQLYARGLYPVIARPLLYLGSTLPWSLSLLLLALLIAWTIWSLLRVVATLLSRGPRRHGRGLRWSRPFLIIGLLALWFSLAWGLNYRRSSVETLLDLPSRQPGEVEVAALALALADQVRADAAAPADASAATAAIARTLERRTAALTGSALRLPDRVKRLPAGALLRFGTAGFISPFLLEAHRDGGLTLPWEVAVSAHELAHLAGFAGEADAELMGILAGLETEQPFARYAVALATLERVRRELPGPVWEEIHDGLPETAQRDLREARDRVQRYYRPALARPLSALYDRYLRSRGVSAGVTDYSRSVRLLVLARGVGAEEEPGEPP